MEIDPVMTDEEEEVACSGFVFLGIKRTRSEKKEKMVSSDGKERFRGGTNQGIQVERKSAGMCDMEKSASLMCIEKNYENKGKFYIHA